MFSGGDGMSRLLLLRCGLTGHVRRIMPGQCANPRGGRRPRPSGLSADAHAEEARTACGLLQTQMGEPATERRTRRDERWDEIMK